MKLKVHYNTAGTCTNELDARPILNKKEKRQQDINVFIKNIRKYDSLAISFADHRSQRGGEGDRGWMTWGANCERWPFRSDVTF